MVTVPGGFLDLFELEGNGLVESVPFEAMRLDLVGFTGRWIRSFGDVVLLARGFTHGPDFIVDGEDTVGVMDALVGMIVLLEIDDDVLWVEGAMDDGVLFLFDDDDGLLSFEGAMDDGG